VTESEGAATLDAAFESRSTVRASGERDRGDRSGAFDTEKCGGGRETLGASTKYAPATFRSARCVVLMWGGGGRAKPPDGFSDFDPDTFLMRGSNRRFSAMALLL
jgi:hypothetical protein